MPAAIGIHVHAEPRALAATLDSVARHTPDDVEILLLPDGPDEPTSAALSTLSQLRQLGTDSALGAAACFNRLVAATDARVVLLLESGSLVSPGWLDRLVAALEASPRHGLAGPSTNHIWNEQRLFPGCAGTPAAIARTAQRAAAMYGAAARPLTALHSLGDFCYAVRRDVVDAIGAADERYGLGPCWEMDYNVRAARAGFIGVWVPGAYVHRSPLTARRRNEEATRFEDSRRRYQDHFCGQRLRGERTHYATHCRGEACRDFAPPALISIPGRASSPDHAVEVATSVVVEPARRGPLVSCIMPTRDRRRHVERALEYFGRQDWPDRELVIVDDGTDPIGDLAVADPRVRYHRIEGHHTVGHKRNLACELARGDLIAHWDDDDWYPPSRLRRQVEALERSRADVCGSSQLYFWDPAAGRAWHYRYRGADGTLLGTSLLYRKSAWARARFADVQVGEDVRFVRAVRGPRHDLVDPALAVALMHPGNTSPKRTTGVYWAPVAAAEIERLLGTDAAHYSAGRSLVSCIMPTYNRRRFVPLSLGCFAAQDWPDWELIIVDDGTDPVRDLCEGVDGVRYVGLSRKLSIGAKRNLACREARGSVIVHWDDDDWYGPDRLRYQVEPILAGRADLTGLENRFVLTLPSATCWTTGAGLHRQMFVGDVHGGTLSFRRSLLDEGIRYPEVNLAEDAAFLREAVRRGRRLERLANPGLFVYVRHADNAWQFEVGRFLDPAGWHRIERPSAFIDEQLEAYRAAAAGGPARRQPETT